jgi:hypothetical protein
MQDLKHRVVIDQNRRSVPVTNLVQMAKMYVVQGSDNIRITSQGIIRSSIWLLKNSCTPTRRARKNVPNESHIVRYDEQGKEHVLCNSKLVTTRREAIAMEDTLQLNFAFLLQGGNLKVLQYKNSDKYH